MWGITLINIYLSVFAGSTQEANILLSFVLTWRHTRTNVNQAGTPNDSPNIRYYVLVF